MKPNISLRKLLGFAALNPTYGYYLNNAEELNGKVDEVSGFLMGLSASIKRRAT